MNTRRPAETRDPKGMAITGQALITFDISRALMCMEGLSSTSLIERLPQGC